MVGIFNQQLKEGARQQLVVEWGAQNVQINEAFLNSLTDAARARIVQYRDHQREVDRKAQQEKLKCAVCGGLPNKSTLYFEACEEKPEYIAHVGCVAVVKRSDTPKALHDMCRQAVGGSMMGNDWYYLLKQDVDDAHATLDAERKAARAAMTPGEKRVDTCEKKLATLLEDRRHLKKEISGARFRKNGWSMMSKLEAKLPDLERKIDDARAELRDAKKELKKEATSNKKKKKTTTGAKKKTPAKRRVVHEDEEDEEEGGYDDDDDEVVIVPTKRRRSVSARTKAVAIADNDDDYVPSD